jgi:hypothetical protein
LFWSLGGLLSIAALVGLGYAVGRDPPHRSDQFVWSLLAAARISTVAATLALTILVFLVYCLRHLRFERLAYSSSK